MTHLHVQARLPDDLARKWVGIAKCHAWFVARDLGWVGKLWAKRSMTLPIRDRAHQMNTFNCIRRHAAEGAWVWTFRDQTSFEGEETPASRMTRPTPTGRGRWASVSLSHLVQSQGT